MGNFLRRHSRELTASTLTLCSLFGVVACADDVPSTKTIPRRRRKGVLTRHFMQNCQIATILLSKFLFAPTELQELKMLIIVG
jgi:hypothetical protein